MSYTELYKISKTGNVSLHTELQNAFRGAMLVWSELEKKYLPPYRPSWFIPGPDREGASRIISGDSKVQQEVWDLWKDDRMSRSEKIVMCSTFDGVYVSKEHFNALEIAFLEFGDQFPSSSYHEQASVISKSSQSAGVYGICWNQTSVNGDMYIEYGPLGGRKAYNIYKTERTNHWELFEGHPELLPA